jgi:hypothetical protein
MLSLISFVLNKSGFTSGDKDCHDHGYRDAPKWGGKARTSASDIKAADLNTRKEKGTDFQ